MTHSTECNRVLRKSIKRKRCSCYDEIDVMEGYKPLSKKFKTVLYARYRLT